ncbi:MAG TPA: hypothetical protein VFE57_08580 [Cyclobacteriaceae bacterium]|jgi:hypothetical protein|nr:hypothetical protein [Cyclobacteriaceae bacterium]
MQLHLRIRPIHSPVDLHPELIEQRLASLDEVSVIRVIDDRVAGGMTMSIVLEVRNVTVGAFAELQKALLKLPKVKVNIMDGAGSETNIANIDLKDIQSFAID